MGIHNIEQYLEHQAPLARHQHGHRRLIEWNWGSLKTRRQQCNFIPSEKWNSKMSFEDANKAGVNSLKANYEFSSKAKLSYERDYREKRRRARGHARKSKMNELEVYVNE
tara:strand:+ start:180 stop:509 length:330 start_codon:yes stop_codon:yes gene_type:complete